MVNIGLSSENAFGKQGQHYSEVNEILEEAKLKGQQ